MQPLMPELRQVLQLMQDNWDAMDDSPLSRNMKVGLPRSNYTYILKSPCGILYCCYWQTPMRHPISLPPVLQRWKLATSPGHLLLRSIEC
jgi:hypothetical protein